VRWCSPPKTILQTSYGREVETAADAYGTALMTRIGGDPRALGTILLRIAGTTHAGPKILLDHPETRDRIAAIETMAPPRTTGGGRQGARPLLDASEWAALKNICSES
jgi:predicted Zn-dependent protease